VIEALRTSILVPHDHLHINQIRVSVGWRPWVESGTDGLGSARQQSAAGDQAAGQIGEY